MTRTAPPREEEVPARRVGTAALAWVSAHRDGFALDAHALSAHGDVNTSWKPLGELAQVCARVRDRTGRADPRHRTAADLLDFAWRQTGHGRLFSALQRLEPFATYPLEVYAAFASAGLREPGYERLAAAVAATRSWRATEQNPNRRLGVLNSERRGGIPRHGPVAPALRRTWLGARPEPWTFERTAGYTLTHVVFHLTDWGAHPGGVPPDLTEYLGHWLPPWLDTCLEGRQWDLAAELAAVAASLPAPPGRALLHDTWTRLAAAQDADGALPETGGGDGVPAPSGFRGCYHSTLMTAFAAALTTARPADENPPVPAAPGTARSPR
jgi:hypothetical protein